MTAHSESYDKQDVPTVRSTIDYIEHQTAKLEEAIARLEEALSIVLVLPEPRPAEPGGGEPALSPTLSALVRNLSLHSVRLRQSVARVNTITDNLNL